MTAPSPLIEDMARAIDPQYRLYAKGSTSAELVEDRAKAALAVVLRAMREHLTAEEWEEWEDWAADNQPIHQGGPRHDSDPTSPKPTMEFPWLDRFARENGIEKGEME